MHEMKDSDIEWIGQIPKEWDIIKCKYVSDLYTGNSIKDEDKSLYEDSTNATPYIATKDIDVIFNTINYENGLYIKNDDNSFVRANKNDILMCIEGGSAGRKKAKLDKTVCFVNKLCCFHPVKINSLFLYYILNSPHYEEEFRFNISGLIGGVSKSKLVNFIFPYPLLEEQQKISAYLDKKCTKIDTIIEKQQKIIEKLKDYKLSRINEIVTNVDGIECNLGRISSMKNGLNFNMTLEGNKVKFLGVGDFKDYFVLNEKEMFSEIIITEEIPQEYLLENGDIVFVRSNGSKELVGRAVMVENIDFALTYSGFCIRFRNTRADLIDDKYLLYFFRSTYFRKQLERYSQGSNISNINQVLLSQISIIIPSPNYQITALETLDKLSSSIDSIITKKQILIEKLTEYKKSLIYEVVTGKKEV